MNNNSTLVTIRNYFRVIYKSDKKALLHITAIEC